MTPLTQNKKTYSDKGPPDQNYFNGIFDVIVLPTCFLGVRRDIRHSVVVHTEFIENKSKHTCHRDHSTGDRTWVLRAVLPERGRGRECDPMCQWRG